MTLGAASVAPAVQQGTCRYGRARLAVVAQRCCLQRLAPERHNGRGSPAGERVIGAE